jgi:release factor glutamine methyltransferase
MGCGSGFLGILLAKSGFTVLAVYLNPEAVDITNKNKAINFVDFAVVLSDLFENVKDVFDLIVFNPPYLPNDAPVDLQWSGGIELIRKFLLDARNHLAKDGKILFLISTLTSEKETIDAIEKNGYKYKILARKKVPWEELVVFELRK